MSSYLSQPYEKNTPRTDENFPLLAKVMEMKQGKYDVAKAQIQQTLDAFGQIQTLRDSDNQYISAKLNDITNQINSFGNKDLSQSSVTDTLMGKIKTAARDPFIVNALEQTAKYKNYQAEVAKVKEKKTELYNDVNYQFGLAQAGFEDYMAGKTDKMGNLGYIPYTDVTKSSLEKIKTLKDLRGDQKIDIVDEKGGKITREIKGLTEEEIFKYFPDLLTSEEDRQLTIDGWAKYKNRMPEAKVQVEQYIGSKKKDIEQAIKDEQTVVENTANSKEKIAEAKAKIANYLEQQEQLTAFEGSVNYNDPVQIGGFLHKQAFKNSIAEMAQAKMSETYSKDEVYFAEKKLELDIKADQRAELELQMKLAKEGQTLDAGGNVVPSNDAISISAKEDTLPELNPLGQLQTDYNETYLTMTRAVRDVYNNSDKITPEMKAQYEAEMKRMGYDANGTVINKNLASKQSKASAMKLAFESSKMSTVHPEVAKTLVASDLRRSGLANDFATEENQGYIEAFDKNADRFIANAKVVSNSATGDKYLKAPLGVIRTGFNFIEGALTTPFGEDPMNPIRQGWKNEKAEQQVIIDKKNALDNFVNQNGGWNNVKNNIKSNPSKIKEMERLVEDLAGSSYSAVSTDSITKEAKEITNKRLIQKAQKGSNVYFTTANQAQITNQGVKEKVISMIPEGKATGALFDPKQNIYFEKTERGDGFVIKQRGGQVNKADGTFYYKAGSEVEVNKEDDLYKYLAKFVDVEEKQKGLNATRNRGLKVSTPNSFEFIDKNRETVFNVAAEHLVKNVPNKYYGAKDRLFLEHPSNFLTQQDSEKVYTTYLQTLGASKEEAQAISENVLSNVTNYKATFAPTNGIWSINLIDKRDGSILYNKSTQLTELEDDLVDITTNYPQTIVSNLLLQYIIKNPKNISNL